MGRLVRKWSLFALVVLTVAMLLVPTLPAAIVHASETCMMEVQLPPDVYVYINGSGWYQDGDHVQLPEGVTISYKTTDKTRNISTGWLTHDIDCTPLAPGYCDMEVIIAADAWVYINGSGWYQNGDHVQLPMGVTISYRVTDINKQNSTDWISKTIDCSDLVYPEPE